jgi:hypothetical protein
MLLSAIITDICEQAGLDAAEIDVSALSDDVVGYQVPRQMPARSALETLIASYALDVSEVDWKVVFKKRGGTSVATVTAADMRAHAAGSEAPDRAVETRTQDIELPTHLTISYESKVRDYEIASQHAMRIDKSRFLRRTAALGIVLEDSVAKRVAEVTLKQLWTARHRYGFALGHKWLKLAPGDVATVNGKDMRIIETAYRFGVLDFASEAEASGVYASTAVADDLTREAGDLTVAGTLPSFIAMDLPPLSEDHGSAGLYFALYGPAAGFAGGTIQRSTDGGANYLDVGFVGATGAKYGACTTTLGNGIEGVLDYTAGVTVDLAASEGTLASATDAQLAAGSNMAAVGSVAGGWEIIQFKTATLVTGNTYALTGLLRGLRGTARFMATHAASEKFVQLDALVGIDFCGALTEAIGVSYLYRVANSSGNYGTGVSYATGGLALDPFPASAVHGGRNSSGDLVLSWQRGDRYEFLTADLPDAVEAMNEVSEAYSVDVIHPSTYAVVRTLTATTPTVTYTAAQQATDSYPAGPITFDIYQVSTVVGRGTVKRVSI